MTWTEFVDYIHELNLLSVFIRLSLAALFGSLLGMDRARKNRPAGFRTHMLVCTGSALVMLTNQFLYTTYYAGDPARLGAQVISGIGFLGAGTIIVTRRSQVVGLTTAAGLWVSACLGLAIGVGFYSAAIIGAILILFIVVFMQGVDEKLQHSSKHLEVYAEFKEPAALSALLGYCVQHGMTINQVEMIEARNSHEFLGAIVDIKLPERVEHALVVEMLNKIEAIEFLAKV